MDTNLTPGPTGDKATNKTIARSSEMDTNSPRESTNDRMEKSTSATDHVTSDRVPETPSFQDPTYLEADQQPYKPSENNSDSEQSAAENSVLEDFKFRIRRPAEYLDKLQSLQFEVFENSAASMRFFGSAEQRRVFPLITSPELRPSMISGDELLDYMQHIPEEHQATTGDVFRGLWDAQNVLAKALANLHRLQNAGYCTSSFSILVRDFYRPKVIRLVKIERSFCRRISIHLKRLFLKVWASREEILNDLAPQKHFYLIEELVRRESPPLRLQCDKIIRLVLSGSNTGSEPNLMELLWQTVHLIDLAILSYSGAHLVDYSDFSAPEPSRPIAINLMEGFPGSTNGTVVPIYMQRCHLQCLDAFHANNPVWTFGDSKTSHNNFLLSTTIDLFADIWGPVWKAVEAQNSQKDREADMWAPLDLPICSHYIVGNGCIVKWRRPDEAPELVLDEVFCHWKSNNDQANSENESELIGEPFKGRETLLIGAFVVGNNDLHVNLDCNASMSKSRMRLIDRGKLHIHGAVQPYFYNDSISYQLQVGYSGVNASAGIQYKRVPGQTLKGAFIELWAMVPEIRNPELLEDLYGLEVSMCTYNSKRVQLSELLSRSCMRNLLKTFDWKNTEYEEEYFRALESNTQEKWKTDADFREVFNKAVMTSLSFLKETGVNRDNNMLVFLSTSATPKPELAIIPSKDHGWIGFLKDSFTKCTLAMFDENCFEFKHQKGSSCGKKGRSALRTNLVLNSLQIPPFLHLQQDTLVLVKDAQWYSRWTVDGSSIGNALWLGEHGTLSIVSELEDSTFLVVWKDSALKRNYQEAGRDSRKATSRIY